MMLQLTQHTTCIRRHVSSVAARPVCSVPRAAPQQHLQKPAKRDSMVARVAEMERTAEEDALMFCYQVSAAQQLLSDRCLQLRQSGGADSPPLPALSGCSASRPRATLAATRLACAERRPRWH